MKGFASSFYHNEDEMETYDEINHYLKTCELGCLGFDPQTARPVDYDVFAFWRNQRPTFKVLSKVAQDFLVASVSSVYSERSFAAARRASGAHMPNTGPSLANAKTVVLVNKKSLSVTKAHRALREALENK